MASGRKNSGEAFLEGLKAIHLGLPQPEEGDGPDDRVSVLVFGVSGRAYAIGVESTEGVVDCPRISPLPGPPDGIVGVASVRGRITVVMDLSLQAEIRGERRRLILLRGEKQLGLLADRLEGVVSLDPREVKAAKGKGGTDDTPGAAPEWPSRGFFKSDGAVIPIIDAARLAEA